MMNDIRRNKALATVLEHARITDASGNQVDLSALSDEAPATPGTEAPASETAPDAGPDAEE
jgi:hypothetical protein